MSEYKNTKWHSISIAWKWPHEGFTVGYDIIEPNPEDITLYYSFVIYLGPLSIIYNWGNHE